MTDELTVRDLCRLIELVREIDAPDIEHKLRRLLDAKTVRPWTDHEIKVAAERYAKGDQ